MERSLRRKLAGLAGLSLSALAGCTDDGSNQQATTEQAEVIVEQEGSSQQNGTTTTAPGDSGSQEVEIGVREGDSPPSDSPGSDIERASFEGYTLFVQVSEESETDAVAVVSPFGNQLGLEVLSEGDESIPFDLVGQTHGEVYPPGEYRIIGFSARGDGQNQSLEQTESHAIELRPDIEITEIRSIGSAGVAQVVVENSGTGPYPISDVRVTPWWRTSARSKWVAVDNAPLILGPSQVVRIPTGTRTYRSVEENIGYEQLQDNYCNGETLPRKVEIRASDRMEWRETNTFDLSLSGEAVKSGSQDRSRVGCTEIRSVEEDDQSQ